MAFLSAKAEFLASTWEEQERRYFYALMSRSRDSRSLVSWGFIDAVLTGQGKYTFSLKNSVLPRDKSTAKE